jgi:isopenicillin N synthase-like dioxygenase
MAEACAETGFFYLANAGLPADLLAEQIAWAARLFALPLKEKLALRGTGPLRGYEPMQDQALDELGAPDLKESFYYDGATVSGAGPWPEAQPAFRRHMELYGARMTVLGGALFHALAFSLDLPPDYFDDGLAPPSCTVRLIHYPPQTVDAASDQLGAGAHTDWGAITILLQDDCGGLEVRALDGAWIEVPPLPDTFVVNLGDMVPRWTNDRYRSSLHRVRNKSAKRDRYSVATFFNPRADYRVECVPTCRPAAGAPRHPACTVGEHVAEMARRTYGKGEHRRRPAAT